MNKLQKKNKVLQIIQDLIQKSPSRITITLLEESLRKIITTPFSRRTLQRYLSELEKQGLISKTTNAGKIVYYSITASKNDEIVTESSISSSESQQIIDYIHQPIAKRKIVNYNHEFLDSYIPGKTYYLSNSHREQLKAMGQSRFPKLDRDQSLKQFGGTYIRNIYQRLLVDLSWASSHLEGNTYTRLETQNLIAFGQAAPGKNLTETQMILNHKTAIEMLVENVDRIGFNSYTFYTLHAHLSYNLLPNPNDSGRLRQAPVEIWGTSYLPMAMPAQIEITFHKILKKASEIQDPYEQSFFVMVHIPYLQAFIDVNKRVSRLGSNISLIRNDLCPLSFVDVDEKGYIDGLIAIYELNRIEILRDVYVQAYERSCQKYAGIVQSMSEPEPLRFKYKDVIFSIVKTIVEQAEKPSFDLIDKILNNYSHQSMDHNALSQMIMEEFSFLHEGNIGRYNITPAQYYKWKS